ncbi:hypothetical protein ABZ319_10545 [Nocardia sp. NPDC005978]|uniref:DUF7373 family lipoprotein n=1 Tax=Nocardia sp. NPDC005978 TaxID=3156725 RepID=UPI0033BBA0CF
MKMLSIVGCSARKALIALPIVATTAVVLTACGSDITGSAAAGEIDIRKLSVGNYSTDPLDVRSTYSRSVWDGKELAMARLGDAVAIGADVDPRFAYGVVAEALPTPLHTTDVLAAAVKPIMESNNFMFGFTASASTHPLVDTVFYDHSGNFKPFGGADTNPEATSFNVTVLQFPDESRARAAGEQIEAADFAIAADQNTHITLDGRPGARAHWRPGVASMTATLVDGQYVVNVFVQQPKPELATLKTLAEQVFTAQLPLLAQSPPLNARDSLRQDYDPDGLLRRTLHKSEFATPDANDEASRTPRGWLHFVADQRTWKQLLDKAGVDRIATTTEGALMFRTRDADSAAALWSDINALMPKTVEAPPNTRDVACVENPKPKSGGFSSAWDAKDRFLCTIRYDRYVARVASSTLSDVHQRAAAQYALLAKSQYL